MLNLYVIVNNKADVELINKIKYANKPNDFANSTIQLRRVSNNTYIDTIYDLMYRHRVGQEIMVRKNHLTHGRKTLFI